MVDLKELDEKTEMINLLMMYTAYELGVMHGALEQKPLTRLEFIEHFKRKAK